MAVSCVTTIPRSIFDAVGFKYERDAAKYDKRFCQFEHLVEDSSSSSDEEEEVESKSINDQVEEEEGSQQDVTIRSAQPTHSESAHSQAAKGSNTPDASLLSLVSAAPRPWDNIPSMVFLRVMEWHQRNKNV